MKNPNLETMEEDVLYHLSLSTKTHNLPEMFGDIKVYVEKKDFFLIFVRARTDNSVLLRFSLFPIVCVRRWQRQSNEGFCAVHPQRAESFWEPRRDRRYL